MWLHSFSFVTAGDTEIEGKNHPPGKAFSPPGDVHGLSTIEEDKGSSYKFFLWTQHVVTFLLMQRLWRLVQGRLRNGQLKLLEKAQFRLI